MVAILPVDSWEIPFRMVIGLPLAFETWAARWEISPEAIDDLAKTLSHFKKERVP